MTSPKTFHFLGSCKERRHRFTNDIKCSFVALRRLDDLLRMIKPLNAVLGTEIKEKIHSED